MSKLCDLGLIIGLCFSSCSETENCNMKNTVAVWKVDINPIDKQEYLAKRA